jgi:hypothetical protein
VRHIRDKGLTYVKFELITLRADLLPPLSRGAGAVANKAAHCHEDANFCVHQKGAFAAPRSLWVSSVSRG